MKINPITGIWIIILLAALMLLADVIYAVATSFIMACTNLVVFAIILTVTILLLKQDFHNNTKDIQDYE